MEITPHWRSRQWTHVGVSPFVRRT